ncbi:hypothetical protein [Candidatus Nitrososphaera sp. FF02]|uniref:hypothetical protein n=1 Tax=Candidatus Nitrososphaera sp. FF02 TaxID=3398226 RepID=UPI0039EB062E
MLAGTKGSSTGDYIAAAQEYYRSERKLLLDTPALTYDVIRGRLEWFRNESNFPAANMVKTGLMIVESGLAEAAQLASADLKQTAQKVTISRVERLLIEFLKFRDGAVECPKCGKDKTHYREYTVVLDSHAMECNSCGHLWKII